MSNFKKVKINATGQVAFVKSSKTDESGSGLLYVLIDVAGQIVWNGDRLNWPDSLFTVYKGSMDECLDLFYEVAVARAEDAINTLLHSERTLAFIREKIAPDYPYLSPYEIIKRAEGRIANFADPEDVDPEPVDFSDCPG